MQPGDWVIIQFGHNDEKSDEARHTDPFTSYTDQLQRYIDESKQRGATPILATPVQRRIFDSQGELTQTHGKYPEAVRKLAARTAVPLLDMTQRSHELLVKLGKDRSQMLFNSSQPGEYERHPKGNQDNTHFNALGATRMCDLAVAEMQRHVPGLTLHLKNP